MKKFAPGLMMAVLLLGGCAMSPQLVEVNPRVALGAQQEKLSGRVNVTVYDDRTSRSLGSRGGVYSDTNRISTTDNFPLSVRSAVELALRQAGMVITDAAEAPQFQVYVDTLSYRVPEGGYVNQVDLKAAVRVVVKNGAHRFNGRYSSDYTQKQMTLPSDEKNEELINKVLSDALSKAFYDQELARFLSSL